MLIRLINRSFSSLIHYRYFSNLIHEENVHENSIRRIITNSSTPLPLIIPTSGVPIHLYTRELESQALKQLIILAESGIVKGFVAAMADVHVGKINKFISSLNRSSVRCRCYDWHCFCFYKSCKSICCWC
jgi:hypothetical protein